MHAWWRAAEGERFWLEITDRPDLGVDLKAPQRGDDGKPYWSYGLLTLVESGDVVLHYHKPESAIVAYSRAVGDYWDEEIVWGAHGTVARSAGVTPYARPGWRRGLEDFTPLKLPLTLSRIRAEEQSLRTVAKALEEEHGGPIYFPFALSDRRPPRPAQGYLTKFPAAMVSVFPELAEVAVPERPSVAPSETVLTPRFLGSDYRPAAEDASTSERDPFSIDPAIVERGLRGHAATQNAIADWARDRGLDPRSPGPGEPSFDVAWLDSGTVFVVEVKSATDTNEEKQLRLGLGQVLRYRHLLGRRNQSVKAVLALEREPRDPSWAELCASLDVWLVWPGSLPGGAHPA